MWAIIAQDRSDGGEFDKGPPSKRLISGTDQANREFMRIGVTAPLRTLALTFVILLELVCALNRSHSNQPSVT